jgi:hypothetical protein
LVAVDAGGVAVLLIGSEDEGVAGDGDGVGEAIGGGGVGGFQVGLLDDGVDGERVGGVAVIEEDLEGRAGGGEAGGEAAAAGVGDDEFAVVEGWGSLAGFVGDGLAVGGGAGGERAAELEVEGDFGIRAFGPGGDGEAVLQAVLPVDEPFGDAGAVVFLAVVGGVVF